MHNVAVLAFDGVVAFDLFVPVAAFGYTRLANGKPGYQVKICGASRLVATTACPILVEHGLSALRTAATVVIPGVDHPERHIDEKLLNAVRRAAARGARIASVCSGALVFARTGLLDGRRVTTHWAAASALQQLHPSIVVDPDVLYIDHGQLLTSAGGVAGLDLCLHMIRRDYGATIAATAARSAVMPLERSGGQAQFIVHEPPSAGATSLAPVLEWMQRNLKSDLSVAVIARRAAMSERTLARRFREQTGTTPAKWVARARVHSAQSLLETSSLAVERVSDTVGFLSPVAFRARFRQIVGVSPADYRRSFRRPSHKRQTSTRSV